MKKVNWKVAITAIVCLTILECFALANGIDGALFMGVAVIIAGIAGYEVKNKLTK